MLNDSILTSVEPDGITATLDPLCDDPSSQYFVAVLLGARKLGEDDCIFMQSVTVFLGENSSILDPLDINNIIIPANNNMSDHEYCARVSFSGQEVLNCKLLNYIHGVKTGVQNSCKNCCQILYVCKNVLELYASKFSTNIL